MQYPIEWANPKANLGLLDERLRAVAGQADIAVVPEMFTTGFCTDRPGLADHGKLYNRGFIFRPDDTPQYYDKHHLYRSGGEADFFTPGNRRTLFEYRGVKIRLAVCYDLRFPVWLRQDKNDMYDLLICVACWPTIRIQYWDALLPARGAENHCYAIGVNMVGTDGMQLDYNGHSAAYDTWLKDVAGFEDYEGATRIVDLSIEKLRHFREVLPQWQEADDYHLNSDY